MVKTIFGEIYCEVSSVRSGLVCGLRSEISEEPSVMLGNSQSMLGFKVCQENKKLSAWSYPDAAAAGAAANAASPAASAVCTYYVIIGGGASRPR